MQNRFCKVYINQTEYHTAQIGTDVNTDTGKEKPLPLPLKFPVVLMLQFHLKPIGDTSSNYGYAFDNEYYIENEA